MTEGESPSPAAQSPQSESPTLQQRHGAVRRYIDVGRLTKGNGGQLHALGYVLDRVHPSRPPLWSAEQYDAPHTEGFHSPIEEPLSTFSIDVDTASYANVRRFLHSDALPPAGAVRIEELVNYFSYDHREPEGNAPFGVTTEWATSPWDPQRELLMVGLRSRSMPEEELPPRNLVFLLDVSGSMQPPAKLPLVKQAMGALVDRLRPEDRVAIVVYAGASGVVLAPTEGHRKGEIRAALERLQAGGSTNGGGGIARAYALARASFRKGGVNRVIFATDGDFNVGTTSRSDLVELIEKERESGVFLTILGVGTGNLKDATMEELADRGNGNYAYLDSLHEARKVLVREAGGTLVTVAKDVKIQVEFNPARVAGYRLLGYENRRLASQDFRDDAKDAGEIGAGHSVTAFYEIQPAGLSKTAPSVPALRYQSREAESSATFGDELCLVKVRFKTPQGRESQLLETAVGGGALRLGAASPDLRYGASVALFGALLRHPDRIADRQGAWEVVRRLARSSLGEDPHGQRAEFLALASRARDLQAELAALPGERPPPTRP
jgi:Ca-activated chloride channel family protein